MTRKDTILIAVVINAGLLAILFTTAIIYDTDKGIESTEFVTPMSDNKNNQIETPSSLIASVNSTGDEVDHVLKYYSHPSSSPIAIEIQPENYLPETLVIQHHDGIEYSEISSEGINQGEYVEVKVKKGDVLEKIAKANKTTVSAIKSANNLQNERLSIGQVLKIPLKQEASPFAAPSVKKQEIKSVPIKEVNSSSEAVYYIVKSGDNPWNIAKQFGVKYDDILHWNHLDEEKARNLKIGDRIRVK